ncbi:MULTISPECIES: alpha/beta hydrolase [Vibrio]|uniref:alpha/beta hydrolase n=1 Tax=Vibrio TaxID=662 RepID=UPI000E6A4B69|nr:alpha/beta hydrolase [Vibrio sp. PID23_8]RIZ55301.1 lipase [Vibrio sp. PID23_8]
MAHWTSRAFNKVLERVMRQRIARCNDVHEMRELITNIDQYGALINAPKQIKRSPCRWADIPCEWVDMPASDGNMLLLYFHGGGFCFVSPNTHSSFIGRVCQKISARGLMVDYRLAPEHTYPAAHDDCYMVYRALLKEGYDSRQIVLMGDSAGGNLVLGTLLRVQQDKLPLPAAAVLLSPVSDMEMTGNSAYEKRNDDPFFDLPSLLLMRNTYLNGAPPRDPLVSPIYADYMKLPPTLIVVGSEEVLLDDSTRLADKLTQAKHPIELIVGNGMPHVYPLFSQIREAGEAINSIAQFLWQHDVIKGEYPASKKAL